ncbi:hypothetical protein [Ohtaekwangia koreensis]|uniref:MetA-pathway of phenol degradation n=1 Tax=Ohtaekwangia koreensis TaxID=688867 RepID=A0A1T5M2Y9_9BACT|nr:hypothetical protein [Ohtaekwangia koreensis]SKC82556.1 hypothetical protein SAMN05660236_4216 [Ohtaekwangia koreensis]
MPRFLPACLLFMMAYSTTFAQGCSDAGFCTMGAMKPDQPFNKKIELKLRSMEISFYRGTTTLTPIVYVATADLNFSLNSKTSFQVKLPYQAVSGSLAKTSGLGDISLCITRTLYTTEKFDINLSVGGKLPTNKSDKDENGYPLPMYYQTSLGTYDFITGISLISKNWLFATGIQHPFNKNNNQFLWSAWQGSGEDMHYIEEYARAKELKRGTDIMFRAERNFRFSRINFSLGVLPIIRINKDEIADANGKRFKQDEAKGMALSGIFTTGYNFNVQSGIKLLIGHKIFNRDINPDGLTRELVSTVSYYHRF